MSKRKVELSGIDMNELDRKIQELALLDFEAFCKMAGVNKVQAFVCFEIAKGKSLQQVGIKLKIGKSTIHLISKKCPQNMDGK